MDNPSSPPKAEVAGLMRRLGAVLYDAILLIGVLFVAAIPLTLVDEELREFWPVQNLIRLYLVTVTAVYFIWFWKHGGQTLGMRAWRIRLLDDNGGHRLLGRLILRFVIAVVTLGLGHLWLWFGPSKTSLQDRLSQTVLVKVAKSGQTAR